MANYEYSSENIELLACQHAVCESCGVVMDKYSYAGHTYRICTECAVNLPDPMADWMETLMTSER